MASPVAESKEICEVHWQFFVGDIKVSNVYQTIPSFGLGGLRSENLASKKKLTYTVT